jgi:hypothetical protein
MRTRGGKGDGMGIAHALQSGKRIMTGEKEDSIGIVHQPTLMTRTMIGGGREGSSDHRLQSCAEIQMLTERRDEEEVSRQRRSMMSVEMRVDQSTGDEIDQDRTPGHQSTIQMLQ